MGEYLVEQRNCDGPGAAKEAGRKQRGFRGGHIRIRIIRGNGGKPWIRGKNAQPKKDDDRDDHKYVVLSFPNVTLKIRFFYQLAIILA